MPQETTDDFENQVGGLLEQLPDEKDLEWAEELFAEKMTEVEDKMTRDIDEDKKQKYAMGLTRSEISQLINLGATDKITLVTLGFNSPLPFDSEVFRGHAIAIPDEGQAGLAQIRLDAEEIPNVGLDFDDLRDLFTAWSMVEVEGSIKDADKLSSAYVIELQGNSTVEAIEPTMDQEEMRDLVSNHVDEVSLREVASNLSLQNEDGYPAEFGIDVKKIPDAYVADLQVGDSSARYIIQDDTVVDPEDLDQTIRGDDIGMTCWMEKELCEYGQGSILDLYGITKASQDGQVMMNIVAIDPIMPQELQQDVDTSSSSSGSSGSSRSENVKENTI